MNTNDPKPNPADASGAPPPRDAGTVQETQDAPSGKGTPLEQAETRTDEANTRTNQANIRTDEAGVRTEQADVRTNLANTQTAEANTRTEQANTRTDEANVRTEQANARTKLANTQTDQANLRTTQAETRSDVLRASELSYRSLFESARDGILILELATGQVSDVNPFLVEMLGFSHDEMVGKTVGELSPFKDAVANLAMLERLQADGYVRYENLPLETRDGRHIDVEFVSNVYLAGDKKVIQCNIRDITERKRAEEALQISKTDLELAHRRAQIGSWKWNLQTGLVEWSDEMFKIFGVDKTDAQLSLEQIIATAIHPDDRERMKANQAAILAGAESKPIEYRVSRGDGEVRYIWADGGNLEESDSGKPLFLRGILQDITERKMLEAQFRQSQKIEGIGQLAGGIAHDFNNILAVIMMQAELTRMVQNAPEEVREGLKEIRAAAGRAADLTRQLLLFSRQQVMQSRQLDLNEVVTSLAKMLQRTVREDVQLQLHLHSAPLMTFADAGMIDQVLMNLAVNARDAMPKGGRLIIETAEKIISPELAAQNPEASPGRFVWLSVSDTGCGMTPEVQSRIFEPFFTTKEVGKGTGLGLATVFGIVKQHHGWLKVYSEVDRGTTIQVFLPASDGSAEVLAKEAAKTKPRGGTETILLVEDYAAVRLVTRLVLERNGYQILEAAGGGEAQRLWTEHQGRIALLLTDLVMPGGVDGHELAALLQAQKPGLKVIFTSGYSADIAGRALKLQAGQKFVQKPCPPDQLLEAVRNCLDGL